MLSWGANEKIHVSCIAHCRHPINISTFFFFGLRIWPQSKRILFCFESGIRCVCVHLDMQIYITQSIFLHYLLAHWGLSSCQLGASPVHMGSSFSRNSHIHKYELQVYHITALNLPHGHNWLMWEQMHNLGWINQILYLEHLIIETKT